MSRSPSTGPTDSAPGVASGAITDDPLRLLADDDILRVRPQVFGGADARTMPTVVDNWTFFDGALCALLLSSATGALVNGTAVLVAPGLAITATHVIEGWLDDLVAGDVTALVLGPRADRLDIWKGRAVTATATDITYLSLELASPISDGWTVRTLPCTTRRPKVGELVHVFGFRVDEDDVRRDETGISFKGDLYVAAGEVEEVFDTGRDVGLIPWPVIQIGCETLGGMSGGAVLDSQGRLLGVTSKGYSLEDGKGPTYASWLIAALAYRVTLTWPQALGRPVVRVSELPDELLHLEGRDYFRAVGEDSYAYTPWS